MAKRKNTKKDLLRDLLMIAIGIVIAILLVKTGTLDLIISWFKDYYILASFISGIFFTSAFTIAPSSVSLVHIAHTAPIQNVMIWGALGAMCGDLILFFFIKDRFAKDLIKAIKPKTIHYIMHSLHLGFFKWLSPVLGAAIIASPLPDEIGITLLGMSKIRLSLLIPVSFVMNMIGIYILIAFSNLL